MSTEPKLRAVQVGCGSMSSAWLNAAKHSNVEIVALVDLYEESARKRAAEFGLQDAVIETDLKRALDKTTPDAVFDSTIPESHVNVTLQALTHGCHVLGEKPLADTMDNARRSVDAALEAGKIYAVIQNRRYDPRIRRLRAFLAANSIGDLSTVYSDFIKGVHFGGFRDRMKHVLLLDMAIHTFDQARFISGADPVSVYAKEWNPLGSWYDHDASAIAIFEMSNGLVYSYRGSWAAEGLNTSWECDWRIIGSRGSVTWDGADKYAAEVVTQSGGFSSEVEKIPVPEIAPDGKEGGHTGLMKEFVHCVQHGGTPETICTDNIKSIAMVFGAIESAEKKKIVDITI